MGKRANLASAQNLLADRLGRPATSVSEFLDPGSRVGFSQQDILQALETPSIANPELAGIIGNLSPEDLEIVRGGLGGLLSTGEGQEFRQLGQSQANLNPSIQAGIGALPQAQEASTLQGFQGNLQGLFPGVQSQLQPTIDELLRGNQFGLSATGGLRSGRALESAADITSGALLPAVTGGEGQIAQRLQQLLQTGRGSAEQLGGIGIGSAQRIGALGQQRAAGESAANAAQAQGITQLLFGAAALSDGRLKKDKVKVGKIGEHQIWKWRWNDAARDMFGLSGEGMGVMAQEVAVIQPDALTVDRGYFRVNYNELGII